MEHTSYLPGCQQKTTSAWNRFYADFASTVYKWVLFLGIAEQGAEEVIQEVFLTAYRKIDTCGSEAQLKSWLFQITRKQAANFRRSAWFKRFWHNKKAALNTDILDKNHSGTLSPEIKQLLRSLPSKQSEVLLLHDLEGFTQSEIAETLGVPTGTVASRLRKARASFTAKWWEDKR